MDFEISLNLDESDESLEVYKTIIDNEDAFYEIDGYIEFVLSNTNFLEKIKPFDEDCFFDFDKNERIRVPIIAFTFNLTELYIIKDEYEEFNLTADFIPFEFILKNDGQNTQILLHSKFDDLWYDGENIIYSLDGPLKSNFAVPNSIFFETLRYSLISFKSNISKKFPLLMENHFVKTSFLNKMD